MTALPHKPSVESLHAVYTKESGMKIALPIGRYFVWEAFIEGNFTESDLIAVCRNIRTQIRLGKRNQTALMFQRLIANIITFEEELQLVRASQALQRRPTYDDGKRAVLKATGREEQPRTAKERMAGDVLAGAKALQDLRKWREENGI